MLTESWHGFFNTCAGSLAFSYYVGVMSNDVSHFQLCGDVSNAISLYIFKGKKHVSLFRVMIQPGKMHKTTWISAKLKFLGKYADIILSQLVF